MSPRGLARQAYHRSWGRHGCWRWANFPPHRRASAPESGSERGWFEHGRRDRAKSAEVAEARAGRDVRRLPHRGCARSRRDGRPLQSDRPRPRPHRGAEDHRARAHAERDRGGPVQGRGAARRLARAPEHRPDPPGRRGGRRPLPRDALRARARTCGTSSTAGRWISIASARITAEIADALDAAHDEGPRPPRRQAREHPRLRRRRPRARLPRRLRADEARRLGRRA